VSMHRLELYVAGSSRLSKRAESALRTLCEEVLPGQYELEVIDILERPEVASERHIIAAPTLIRADPPPPERLIGDLSDRELVIAAFKLDEPPGK
jgi:circadian clock protein KaiB